MSHIKTASRIACALLMGGLIWPASGGSALAQEVKADQIIEALTPRPIIRSLTAPAQPAMNDSDRAFVDGLRHLTRSLTLDERDRVAAITRDQKRPDVNLVIYFDLDSATISPKAEPQLAALAEALRKGAQLKGALMVLNGHTDAYGSDDYNQQLSQRRAEAVKKYLMDKYQIPAENLSTAGYGKNNLKDAGHPYAAENRRVQIVNLETAAEAKR